VLNKRACLSITLYKLSHSDFMINVSLFASVSLATISRYIKWRIKILWKVFDSLLESFISLFSFQYFMAIREFIRNHYRLYMKNYVFVIDGSIHSLKKDYNVQDIFFYNKNHFDYNN
jgi:hypothetical protein